MLLNDRMNDALAYSSFLPFSLFRLAHAFGILTILVARFESSASRTISEEFSLVVPYLPILVTVPLPTAFYLITVPFTDPYVLRDPP